MPSQAMKDRAREVWTQSRFFSLADQQIEAIAAFGEAIERETRAECGWHDISTAPKDGTVFDLMSKAGTRWRAMRWSLTGRNGFTEAAGPPILYAPDQFTHWQPLAEPPPRNQNTGEGA